MLRDSEGRTREMAKDHKLFHPKQVLRATHFIMEDMTTVRQIIQDKDFMIKIDLEIEFHHIPVDPAF
ncbi:MAG: hypothetical protein EZS28_035287 [Streblomastix strix]|uniref:Reverse transcriptase domain-containing protein n=1 Tax=Streblomastix strix TaxID=222440 RepID=A0A5J4UEJ7_9EUKA|nr:MAG: hypothetical protein EZS28_035287 [Streblomastix strix]